MAFQIPAIVQTQIGSLDSQQIIVAHFIRMRVLTGTQHANHLPILADNLTGKISDLRRRTHRNFS
jgi:hypothetical protein